MKNIIIYYYLLVKSLPKYIFSNKVSIFSFDDTVSKIIKEKKSLARFGDGEIMLMFNEGVVGFQRINTQLAARLREVFDSTNDNLLIGLPNIFTISELMKYRLSSKIFWLGIYFRYIDLIPFKDKFYADTNITRPYYMYQDIKRSAQKFNRLKQIWNNQDVLIVEGEFSRLGVGNDLFDNTRSIQRILCPSKNAFDKYEIILEEIHKYAKDKLILIALGPTATVLAYDLSKLNFWAIDIGHIDVEYIWFLNKEKEKVAIKGKYVNEIGGIYEEFNQDVLNIYNSTIISKIL